MFTLCVVLGSACVSQAPPNPGDSFFDQGDYAAAAAAYEEILRESPRRRTDEPELAYRLALLHAVPGHQATDFERARQLLEPLLDTAEYATRGGALLALMAEIDRLRNAGLELETAAMISDAHLRQLEAGKESCESMLSEERRLRSELATHNHDLRARVAALEEAEAELARRLRTLSEELDAIKKIDLQHVP